MKWRNDAVSHECTGADAPERYAPATFSGPPRPADALGAPHARERRAADGPTSRRRGVGESDATTREGVAPILYQLFDTKDRGRHARTMSSVQERLS